MSEAKRWAYEELTEETQDLIDFVLKNKLPEEVKKERAYGAFLLWDFLTMGWQVKGDNERLLALAATRLTTRKEECKAAPEFVQNMLRKAMQAKLEEIKRRENLNGDSELTQLLGISMEELDDIRRSGSFCELHEQYPEDS